MNKISLDLTVNGQVYEISVSPTLTLLDILRYEIGLTGTKKGCGTGDCGACTVLVNGRAANACLILAPDAKGADITTIEGLAVEGELHPIQQAFVDHGAIQCGFCSPGMIMSAADLLNRNPNPTAEEAKNAISGNLCRCTGYIKIIEAITAVNKHE
ncbi:MAG: (2Fe-2S)-binding protein [Candidatus Thermoplasmatota archaeon]|jgi:carbon-monoxide dehydrogenase small subunit|nr:(2Fe-2S)-binding protein [Candidatus Thermoplasmatota archaeon]